MPVPRSMVKKAVGDTLDYLADNLKSQRRAAGRQPVALSLVQPVRSTARSRRAGPTNRCAASVNSPLVEPDDGVDIVAAQRRDQLSVAGHRRVPPTRHRWHSCLRQVSRDVQQEPGQLDPARGTVERTVEGELRRDDLFGVAALDRRGNASLQPFELVDLVVGDPLGRRRGELLGDGGLQPEDVLDVPRVSGTTTCPRWGSSWTMPSPRRVRSASRTGVMLTPQRGGRLVEPDERTRPQRAGHDVGTQTGGTSSESCSRRTAPRRLRAGPGGGVHDCLRSLWRGVVPEPPRP